MRCFIKNTVRVCWSGMLDEKQSNNNNKNRNVCACTCYAKGRKEVKRKRKKWHLTEKTDWTKQPNENNRENWSVCRFVGITSVSVVCLKMKCLWVAFTVRCAHSHISRHSLLLHPTSSIPHMTKCIAMCEKVSVCDTPLPHTHRLQVCVVACKSKRSRLLFFPPIQLINLTCTGHTRKLDADGWRHVCVHVYAV